APHGWRNAARRAALPRRLRSATFQAPADRRVDDGSRLLAVKTPMPVHAAAPAFSSETVTVAPTSSEMFPAPSLERISMAMSSPRWVSVRGIEFSEVDSQSLHCSPRSSLYSTAATPE